VKHSKEMSGEGSQPQAPAADRTGVAGADRGAAENQLSDQGRSGTRKRLSLRSPRAALQAEPIPEASRPSRRARHPLVVVGSAVLTLILAAAVATGLAIATSKHRFELPGPLADAKIVNIPKGLGLRDIADLLQREGVIEQPWLFIGGALIMKAREELKHGEYEFKKQASLKDVVDTIVEGKVYQHQLTIPEGLTSQQIVERLMQDQVLSGNVSEIPREGTLLPETYRFARGTTREQLVQRMQQAQRRVIAEIWDRRAPDLPLKTPQQLVVLASLVEKETGKPDERTRIAAVFVNRLKLRMRLQSDPTIIYGLAGGRGSLGHPISRSEIEQPTPYNTYVIDGLPPGPITNSGRASLEAAATPARTKELFFVADGSGGHVFAETLEQHQKNVGRLRQIEQGKDLKESQQMGSAPAALPALAGQPSREPAPATRAGARSGPSSRRGARHIAPARAGEAAHAGSRSQ
jgi:peptidoglycan lytic transglycosylase G